MDLGPYSPYKAANISHMHRMLALSKKELPSPAQVHLVLTNGCNHNCSFCAYRSAKSYSSQTFNSSESIPSSRIMPLLEELKATGTDAVQLTGGGEPLLYTNFMPVLSKIHSLGMSSCLVTNGNLLNREGFDLKEFMKCSWIRISLDAASADSYSSIRDIPKFSFDITLDNIRELVRLKKELKSSTLIGVGFVVNESNYKELPQFFNLVNSLGVDNIRISAAFFPGSAAIHSRYQKEVVDSIAESAVKLNKGIRLFNLFGDRLEDLQEQAPKYTICNYARLVPYIGADCNVYTCCILAYNKAGLIGSIKDKSFSDFWKTTAAEYFTKHTTASCKLCMFNNKNRFIDYLISKESEHVAFI